MFITDVSGEDLPVSILITQPVRNGAGETIGKVHELIMEKNGHITTALIDVGSFVGSPGKMVAVPFNSLAIDTTADPKPSIVAEFSKEDLSQAPQIEWSQRSYLDRLKVQGAVFGQLAAAKASELMQKAGEKASEVGEKAMEKASALSHTASEKASEVGEKAMEKASALSQTAAEKASEIGHKVVEKTSELTRKVVTPDDTKGEAEKSSKE